MALSREEWRPVPSHEGAYEVSNCGRVRSLEREIHRAASAYRPASVAVIKGRLLKPGRCTSGHMSVVLGRASGSHYIHALVLCAFAGPRPPETEARHLNGDPADNRLSNLEWSTRSRNTQDKKWHVLPRSYRLRPADVREIRAQYAAGVKLRVLAETYGVSRVTVSKTARGLMQRDVL